MREDGVEIDKIVMKISREHLPDRPAASAQVECGTTNNAFANNNKSFSMKESGGNGEINWGNFFEEFKDNYVLERSIDGVTYSLWKAMRSSLTNYKTRILTLKSNSME